MSEEEQKYFIGLIGFTFDSDDIRYIEKIVEKKDKEIERLNNKLKQIDNLVEEVNESYLVDEDMFKEFYDKYYESKDSVKK